MASGLKLIHLARPNHAAESFVVVFACFALLRSQSDGFMVMVVGPWIEPCPFVSASVAAGSARGNRPVRAGEQAAWPANHHG